MGDLFPNKLLNLLERRRIEKNYRQLTFAPKHFIDFYSNDYLGIAKSLSTVFTSQPLSGSTGSRLISGNYQEIQELEKRLAIFYEAETCLLFNSGYNANLGVLACLPRKDDCIFYDESIHASMRDGIRLSYATSFSFNHQNLNELRQKIKKFGKGMIYIAVESLYSMSGSITDLEELCRIASEFNAWIILDEAHGTGVLGKTGKGLYQEFSSDRILARIHTFGKSLGIHGAIVAGSLQLNEFLINFSKTFIYTTALPLHDIEAIQIAHNLFESEPQRRNQLKDNISFFLHQTKVLKLDSYFLMNKTPIQSFYENSETLLLLEEKLKSQNYWVKSIFSPTVTKSKECLRISLHSFNSRQDIRFLLQKICSSL